MLSFREFKNIGKWACTCDARTELCGVAETREAAKQDLIDQVTKACDELADLLHELRTSADTSNDVIKTLEVMDNHRRPDRPVGSR